MFKCSSSRQKLHLIMKYFVESKDKICQGTENYEPNKAASFTFPAPPPAVAVMSWPLAFILNCEHLLNPNIILLFQRPHVAPFSVKI